MRASHIATIMVVATAVCLVMALRLGMSGIGVTALALPTGCWMGWAAAIETVGMIQSRQAARRRARRAARAAPATSPIVLRPIRAMPKALPRPANDYAPYPANDPTGPMVA